MVVEINTNKYAFSVFFPYIRKVLAWTTILKKGEN